MESSETRGSIAARQAAGTLLWIGVNDSAVVQRLEADHLARLQESANFGGPEKLNGAHDPQQTLRKNGGLADQWYMDEGDVMRRPILVLSLCRTSTLPMTESERRRNPLKTELIYFVNDLDAAPPEWGVGRRAELGQNLCSHRRGATNSESQLGLGRVHHGPTPEQGRCHPSDCVWP